METIEPGQIPPEVPHSNLGRVGLWLSLAAPAALVLMVVLQPGWSSPLSALGGLTIFLTPPIALILSIVGWIRGGHRMAAMGGVVISTLVILVFFVGLSLLTLCR